MQVFTCLWNLTLLGSSDLLFIDPYDTMIQSHACSNSRTWRNLFRKQNHGNSHAQTPPMPHTYMRIALMIPHSYLVHFELVQTCCLSSYAMHIRYFDHPCTRHQNIVRHDNHTKPRHPPERKRKQEMSHHAHESLLKKKEEKRGR